MTVTATSTDITLGHHITETFESKVAVQVGGTWYAFPCIVYPWTASVRDHDEGNPWQVMLLIDPSREEALAKEGVREALMSVSQNVTFWRPES